MTCKDCIHYYVCDVSGGEIYDTEQKIRDDCSNFMRADNTVEVVRCKDCKRCEKRKRVDGTYLFSCRSGCFKEVVSADHYCSYGERKDNAN